VRSHDHSNSTPRTKQPSGGDHRRRVDDRHSRATIATSSFTLNAIASSATA
jgi:hypothetical protein